MPTCEQLNQGGALHEAQRAGMGRKKGPPRGRGQKPGMEHETDRLASASDVMGAHYGKPVGKAAPDPKPSPTPQTSKNAIENLQRKKQMLKDVMSW